MPLYSSCRLRYRRKTSYSRSDWTRKETSYSRYRRIMKQTSYSRSRLRYRRRKTLYYRSRPIMKKTPSSSTGLSRKDATTETRNWVDNLPRDVLQKVGTIDILVNVQRVCLSWRKICKDPIIWRSIDIHDIQKLFNLPGEELPCDVSKMIEIAIDKSCGQLININLEYTGNDQLLKYITDRKIQLKTLRIKWSSITDEGLSEAAKMMSSIEELYINFGGIKHIGLENVGLNCPGLKSLTYIRPVIVTKIEYEDEISFIEHEEDYYDGIDPNSVALAISRTMPQLQHLNLIGNGMTNEGLQAILDSCPRLESLDLRKCFRVDLTSDPKLGKRCSSIKEFYHPSDSTDPGDEFESYDAADYYFTDNDDFDSSDNGDLDYAGGNEDFIIVYY
ncbi:putative F-box/LRR-repeat protein 23 [Impatiens glandulifera]|uniref:putative F-box/LRR-repeat protein 23 n=1 Tax=Impatiens glandulifera TaxID=253017 RepID=UPI001FB15197|nr:putative F-box/LRR-repeat protein 23 [Impatiens glandulifera]